MTKMKKKIMSTVQPLLSTKSSRAQLVLSGGWYLREVHVKTMKLSGNLKEKNIYFIVTYKIYEANHLNF